ELRAVRIVAVAAGHALRKHLALLERSVIVDLVLHLPIGEVEAMGERRDDLRVGEPRARDPTLRNRPAARVAEPAGFDLLAQRRRRRGARRVSRRRIDCPGGVGAFVEADDQTFRVVRLVGRPPTWIVARPGDVPGALPMAGFASDADLGPGGRE